MAQIDLANYEPVEERIARFYRANPEARIITELVSADGEPGRTRWVVKALVYKDTERDKPDSTGYAFELDGAGMTQKTAALETCETSAIGRALANLNYSGNRRVTREEMAKVQRAEQPSVDVQAIMAAAQSAPTKSAVRGIWEKARKDGAYQAALDQIVAVAKDKPDE